MYQSLFEISKMDCPSEENLIRMKLEGVPSLKHLDFNIAERKLTVFHEGDVKPISEALQQLKLGSTLIETTKATQTTFAENTQQKKLLWMVLAINFSFFIIEMTTGLISKSIGLVADSLDMLADSFVYGISLLAVGGTVSKKKKIATLAGYFQIALAIVGFVEVVRRFLNPEVIPDFKTMITVAILALLANAVCLYLLQKSKSKKEAHMQASMIFTSNDIIINLGVIIAGVLVLYTQSNLPDLLIGTIVFLLVIQGALRILKLGK